MDQFAARFATSYRRLYELGATRLSDARERLAPETMALLQHLAQAGPSTLGELCQHLSRAPSTLSAKLQELEAQGWIERQRDERDARRSLLWLSPLGLEQLELHWQVLDLRRLEAAAAGLKPELREALLQGLQQLIEGFHSTHLGHTSEKGR